MTRMICVAMAAVSLLGACATHYIEPITDRSENAEMRFSTDDYATINYDAQ